MQHFFLAAGYAHRIIELAHRVEARELHGPFTFRECVATRGGGLLIGGFYP